MLAGGAVSYVRWWGEGDGGVSRFGMAGGGKEGGSWEIPLGRAFATTDKNLLSAPPKCILGVPARADGRPTDAPRAQKQDRREEEEEEGRKFINATCSWFFGVGSWAAMLRVFFLFVGGCCQVGVSNREIGGETFSQTDFNKSRAQSRRFEFVF